MNGNDSLIQLSFILTYFEVPRVAQESGTRFRDQVVFNQEKPRTIRRNARIPWLHYSNEIMKLFIHSKCSC